MLIFFKNKHYTQDSLVGISIISLKNWFQLYYDRYLKICVQQQGREQIIHLFILIYLEVIVNKINEKAEIDINKFQVDIFASVINMWEKSQKTS